MGWFIIVVVVLCGIGISLKAANNEEKKLEKMTPSERAEYRRRQQVAEDKAKYNGLKYTCPMCGSRKIKTISKTSRGFSVYLFGGGSDKIGKLYECDDCKYKW